MISYATVYTEGLRDPEVSAEFDRRLLALRTGGPLECPHIIDGQKVTSGRPIEREDPTDPSRMVAITYEGGEGIVDRAVAAAGAALDQWSATSVADRCEAMLATARRIADRRVQIAALMTHEVGKTRADTLAEVDECVVMLKLYVSQMREHEGYTQGLGAPAPGARSEAVYRPYGVFGIVLPFNFPFALATGMAAAAIITGNTVVYKPSALTPASGAAWAELFNEALPVGVVQLVQGDVETGRALTASRIDGLGFTGSVDVGLEMAQRMVSPPYIRPFIAEMGGKNPAIVTGAAVDIEQAAKAIARSAFGLAGQKCTACSRAIVTADIHDKFVEALVAFTETLKVGDPFEPDVFTGPMIKRSAHERFVAAVAEARQDGTVRLGGNTRDGGYYAEPTVVTDLPEGHRLARKELFMPLLTVVRVSDIDAAIEEANSVEYGLSSALYSADETEQAAYLARIETGITSINNPNVSTTGQWPGTHTMTGWKATGATGKGGFGPYYLLQYMREQGRQRFVVS